MKSDHMFVGIYHQQVKNKYGWMTYIIIGDKTIHDTTDLNLSNKVNKSKLDDSMYSFERMFQKVQDKNNQKGMSVNQKSINIC